MIGEEVIAVYGDAGDGEELFEVQKLVRCKECKWYEPLDSTRLYDCSRGLAEVAINDFCSYGERKESE